MQFKVLFLLMGGLSIATAVTVYQIEENLENFLKYGGENPIDTNEHHLQLINRLASTTDVLVWEALFDGHQVAIKISVSQSYTDQEIAGYRAANAMDDPNIESKGIPKIYYTGHIFEQKYPVIVMTLFDESLYDRWIKQGESFNAYTILQVLFQMAKTLDYLQSRRIKHNDIKPQNIFFSGKKVFLGDFDCATLNGEQSEHGSTMYASANYWKKYRNLQMRIPNRFIDDLESLVYTIWFIEKIHYSEPPGLTMRNNKNNELFLMEKCKHFKKFPKSFEALKFICYKEIITSKSYADYENIIRHLKAAKKEVKRITGQNGFEWRASSSSSSSSSAYSGSSFKFEYPDEFKPSGRWDPDWL